ncbi:MAG: hypothetical protein LBP19_01820 [Treponema sp.]|nr:hypothetical protein [Treponema sp.]
MVYGRTETEETVRPPSPLRKPVRRLKPDASADRGLKHAEKHAGKITLLYTMKYTGGGGGIAPLSFEACRVISSGAAHERTSAVRLVFMGVSIRMGLCFVKRLC